MASIFGDRQDGVIEKGVVAEWELELEESIEKVVRKKLTRNE